MEEEKAAAYYDELTRKGEGAARFKQGLGFSSQSSETTTNNPTRGSALSNFVRASSPGKETDLQKQTQLENIQNKLKKKQNSERLSRVSDSRSRDGSRRRSSSRERDRSSKRRSRSRDGHDSRRRNRSLSRDRDGDRVRRSERRRRSRSRSSSDEERKRRRSSRERRSKGRRSRSSSPRDRRLEKGRGEGKSDKERNGGVDYSRLIKGYVEMTPAERVKAKIKLQLSQTVEQDTAKGMGAGWERFEFNKDAPLDDEEIEAAEDDAVLVKNMGQSFRFSAVEARKEEQIKTAHDNAMFGTPVAHDKAIFGAPASQPSIPIDEEPTMKNDRKEIDEIGPSSNLISDKVLAKQQGSWRDRARKLQGGSKS